MFYVHFIRMHSIFFSCFKKIDYVLPPRLIPTTIKMQKSNVDQKGMWGFARSALIKCGVLPKICEEVYVDKRGRRCVKTDATAKTTNSDSDSVSADAETVSVEELMRLCLDGTDSDSVSDSADAETVSVEELMRLCIKDY